MLAFNHFHWIDPPRVGAASPRTVHFLAKVEAHRVPGLGQLIRSFGTISVRRGESDREAVRLMREAVRDGHALGLFAEGTRQLRRCAGRGAAGRGDGRDPGGRAGRPGRDPRHAELAARQLRTVSIAWGEPLRFEGLPKGGKGYREASAEIERRIHALHDWLAEIHALGRPREAVPPRMSASVDAAMTTRR